MAQNTTIKITKEVKNDLTYLKIGDEDNYNKVIERLIRLGVRYANESYTPPIIDGSNYSS